MMLNAPQPYRTNRMSRTLLLWIALAGVIQTAPAQNPAPPAADPLALPASDDAVDGAGPIRRADWFVQTWNRRRGEFAQSAGADRGAVVLLGDSITDGFNNSRLAAAFPGLSVANRGISGDTTRGMLYRLQTDVLAIQPAAVVILGGTNDLADDATPEMIARNVSLILAACSHHDPAMPVVLCAVMPSDPSKSRPPAAIAQINRLLAAMPKQFNQATFLDTHKLFAGEDQNAREAQFPDLLHPNQSGYDEFGKALSVVFGSLGLIEPSEPPPAIEPGFEPLIVGDDLTGWRYRASTEGDRAVAQRIALENPPRRWQLLDADETFDDRQTPDGRFSRVGDRLVIGGPPGPQYVQSLWTTRKFGRNLTLRLQFRAAPNADSGVFLGSRQLQVRDYSLAGPYRIEAYRPMEFNDLEIVVIDGVATATCNGEVFETDWAVPLPGPIGLEADRGVMEYRAIRVRDDSTKPINP